MFTFLYQYVALLGTCRFALAFTVLASAADSYKALKMHPFVAFVKPGLFLQLVL